MTEPNYYTLAENLIGLPHEVGICGVPVADMGMTNRIMQLSAHLAAANAEIERLRERLGTIHELAVNFDRTDLRACQLRLMSIAQEAGRLED